MKNAFYLLYACVLGIFILLAAGVAVSKTPSVLVVLNDDGGSIRERVEQIDRLNRDGTLVQITGDRCNSACTMYLGMDTVCISPDTVFGFHGPSSQIYGVGLSPEAFEFWSHIMADHYPSPIKEWFLKDVRHIIVGLVRVRGSDLIDLGIPACRK